MRIRTRQSGLTLMEVTVVILIVALLTSLSVPAIRTFFSSMAMSDGAEGMISAALATARAVAAKEQNYAGIRFQTAYHPDGPLSAPQYMIFIVHDFDNTGLAPGFRAVEGLKPIKLPENVGVMDLLIDGNIVVDNDLKVTKLDDVTDTTTFSIVFSPSGKLVIHEVRVRNRDGIYQPDNSVTGKISMDDVFNSLVNINDYKVGLFIQDDYPVDGLDEEPSRSCFIVYDREQFRQAYSRGEGYSGYLYKLVNKMIYINPYTGTMINSD